MFLNNFAQDFFLWVLIILRFSCSATHRSGFNLVIIRMSPVFLFTIA